MGDIDSMTVNIIITTVIDIDMICNCLLMTIAIGIATLTPPTILTSYNGINLIIIIVTALTTPAVCPHDKFSGVVSCNNVVSRRVN